MITTRELSGEPDQAPMSSSSATPASQPRLEVSDGRIVLVADGRQQAVRARDVYAVVRDGASEIQGHALAAGVRATCPDVKFWTEALSVGLRISDGRGEFLAVRPAVRHAGSVVEIDLADDHVLIGADWYPLEPESKEEAAARLQAGELIGPVEYARLYRGAEDAIEIWDEVTAERLRTVFRPEGQPPGLRGELYPYQKTGYRWLSSFAQASLGLILADEMGLGKTIQVIALLEERRHIADAPSLLVLPLTLIPNWLRELHMFAPDIRVYVHHGAGRAARPAAISEGSLDLVITTYDTAVGDIGLLSMIDWDLVIADEAQAIKNPDTARASSLGGLTRNAGIAVTGTPVENRALDLWALTDFAVPGHLGDRLYFEQTMERDPALLERAARPIVLRREVDSVAADLPDLIDVDVPLEMLPVEAQFYESLRERAAADADKTPGIGALQHLRMCAAHPSLMDPAFEREPFAVSAKLQRLFAMLTEALASGDKVLIACDWLGMSDLLQTLIQSELGVPVWKIDGRTRHRQDLVDDFSSAPSGAVLILNPRAAGTGLNIQAAAYVVHYTLQWNPAIEDQVTARAYRPGQTRPVRKYRMYYRGTVDEVMVERLQRKRELFGQLVKPTDDRAEETGRGTQGAGAIASRQ